MPARAGAAPLALATVLLPRRGRRRRFQPLVVLAALAALAAAAAAGSRPEHRLCHAAAEQQPAPEGAERFAVALLLCALAAFGLGAVRGAAGGPASRGAGSGARGGGGLAPCRTSTASQYRLRCAERVTGHLSGACPVRLIVFDLDETLTMATFMASDGSCLPREREKMAEANFESPWVDGSRRAKLQRMLEALARGPGGRRRFLAVLTRNANAAGVLAVVNLLKAGGLAEFFCAIWTMPWRKGKHNGAYLGGDGEWQLFDPPVDEPYDHKADVLAHVCRCPEAWVPQLAGGERAAFADLLPLTQEGVVLVDDQRSNFRSPSGVEVLRYCKVARYDADYRSFGFVTDMGGIGAHSDADYDMLQRFVEDPWMCRDSMQVRCNERAFVGSEGRNPVQLVVFDFDETLTLATFMPSAEKGESEWSEADLRRYNFETPWVEEGSRVDKLGALLRWIAAERRLAVLTKNERGAMAVLSLLRIAGLAEHFSAIWTMRADGRGGDHGAYQEGGRWTRFQPPVERVGNHKADVLRHVVDNPSEWFPQLQGPQRSRHEDLLQLRPEGVVLVDDERANFRSYEVAPGSEEPARVLRYCKVFRYDDEYRDCGLLNQMGGLGAHSDSDYAAVRAFIEAPWDYPYEGPAEAAPEAPARAAGARPAEERGGGARLQRVPGARREERPKAPRRRPGRPA